uniref:Uncharacterized protein n=1 Tax=Tanacetum cinerariifolium TaxID=118510 RepID=A0A699I7E0_TANCI|nr:hypothetical protein [Tanacetum cinerariifolium]
MQEFWATVSIHHTSLRFKMNSRSHTLNIKNFTDMLQICLRRLEAEQIKLATKRSKKDFHISHASGSGDGVDTQSKGDSEDEDDISDDGDSNDHDDNSDDERTESDSDETPDLNLTNVDQNEYEEDDDVIKELYDDVNVNLGNDDDRC